MISYPKHFPDNCPPVESSIASGEFYRFIKEEHQMAQSGDFLSWRQENPDQKCPAGISECQACGISIFPSLDAVKNIRLRVRALNKKKIAIGTL